MADQDPRRHHPPPPTTRHPDRSPPARSPSSSTVSPGDRPPALGGDPAEHAALLACKADLFARIADQHAHTDPAHAGQARQAAERARAAAARHAENPETQDSTDVNDLTSPLNPEVGNFAEQHCGISPSVITAPLQADSWWLPGHTDHAPPWSGHRDTD